MHRVGNAAAGEDSKSTGSQTQRLLFIGFGGLLALLAFTGFNALSVIGRIQTRNESIRQDYLNRERILENLRSDLYLSGTYVRDFLLEPDPERADLHRREFSATRNRIDSMTASYEGIVSGQEKTWFQRFKKEVAAYFDSLAPALQWNADQRKSFGYAFMKDSLLPRRMTLLRLADQISRLNQQQMEAGTQRVAELFADFRTDLVTLLIITLLIGCLLAGGSMFRILRLERLSGLRFEEVQQARSALSDLSARLVEVQEGERRALSRELHDEVGQTLSALLLAVGNAASFLPSEEHAEARQQLLEARKLAEITVGMVRNMSLLLRPSMLDDLGLIPALEWQAREVARNHGLHVVVHADSIPEDLPDDQRTCVYRVVQEALRNVIRHASAKHVQIRLTLDGETLHLRIGDDGQGFRPEREKGVGLLGMEERVKHLGGSFQIQSQPGGGTVIQVDLPRSVLSHCRN